MPAGPHAPGRLGLPASNFQTRLVALGWVLEAIAGFTPFIQRAFFQYYPPTSTGLELEASPGSLRSTATRLSVAVSVSLNQVRHEPELKWLPFSAGGPFFHSGDSNSQGAWRICAPGCLSGLKSVLRSPIKFASTSDWERDSLPVGATQPCLAALPAGKCGKY